jgi:hypothetical protein
MPHIAGGLAGGKKFLTCNVKRFFRVVKEFFQEENVGHYKGGRTMENIDSVLDAAKAVTGSDNKTADYLGESRQLISGWRQRGSKPNDIHRAKLCLLTGWSMDRMVAAVNYEKNPEFWGNFQRRLGAYVAAVIVGVTSIVTPTPSEAAPILKDNSATVYIMLNRMRRLKQLALGLIEQITRFRILVPQIS